MKNINNVPEWFKRCSVYQINPRTFSREGTIKAVTAELPLLARLGFGVMYMCPIFREDTSEDRSYWSKRQLASETNNPKNPYRMNDYFEIDSEYGTMEELREFTDEAHRLGMRVILDLVYLHIGPDADIIKVHPEFAAKNEDGTVKLTRWNFPYLNYENEGLREYLMCNMVYYVGVIGVDGFRCDVGDEVPLDFWREGKRRIRTIKPDAVMINEGQLPEYLNVFDANYGFYWHELLYGLINGRITAEDTVTRYREMRERYPKGALILRDMDNHDTVTDRPYRIEEHFGNDCMELILATNYTIDGVPMVYCGNELADRSRLSMFANRFYPGKFEFTDRKAIDGAALCRMELVTGLNRLKAESAVLTEGETAWLEASAGAVLAFERILGDERIAFAGNFSQDEVELKPFGGEVLLSNNAEYADGKVRLYGYGYIITKRG